VETGLSCGIGFAATLAKDPLEKKNLLQEQPQLAGNLEKKLFNYLKAVEGKTFRSVLFNVDPWAF